MRFSISTSMLVCAAIVPAFADERSPFDLTPDQDLIEESFELNVDMVAQLLGDKADPNAKFGFYQEHMFRDNWSGALSPFESVNWTALLAVANSPRGPKRKQQERRQRRLKIAKLLLKAGAFIDADDGNGTTALAAAINRHNDDLATLLIEHGAKLNTKAGVYIDGTGDITPLHEAVRNPKLVRLMIARGANVNALDDSGDSPLHWAVRAGAIDSARMLLKAQAVVDIANTAGDTPLDLAYRFPHRTSGNEPISVIRRRMQALLTAKEGALD